MPPSDPAVVDPAAVAVVKRFFFAVAIGDGEAVWEELDAHARAYVLNVAVQQGMDFELGSRLRLGTADDEEWAAYLGNLVGGLQRDLDGLDLASLVYEAEPLEGNQVRVRYAVPLGLSLPDRARPERTLPDRTGPERTVPGGDQPARISSPTIPAGSVVTAHDDSRWGVRRLVPRPGR